MLLNSYLWNKGLKKNRLSNDIDDIKTMIPNTPLSEIGILQDILIKEDKKIETKKIKIKKNKERSLEDHEEVEPIVKEVESVVKEVVSVVKEDKESEGGFMELEEESPGDIDTNEHILSPKVRDSDIKHVIVTRFY